MSDRYQDWLAHSTGEIDQPEEPEEEAPDDETEEEAEAAAWNREQVRETH